MTVMMWQEMPMPSLTFLGFFGRFVGGHLGTTQFPFKQMGTSMEQEKTKFWRKIFEMELPLDKFSQGEVGNEPWSRSQGKTIPLPEERKDELFQAILQDWQDEAKTFN